MSTPYTITEIMEAYRAGLLTREDALVAIKNLIDAA